MTALISAYGVWLVAGLIALECICIPVPGETILVAAALYAGSTHKLHIVSVIAAAVVGGILGNVVAFWLGRRYGYRLLMRHGHYVKLDATRIKIGQYLFLRHGSKVVFIARFIPIARSFAAVLAGTNRMPSLTFYLASGAAAVAWVVLYAWGAHSFGAAFDDIASPAAIVLAVVAVAIVVGIPLLIRRYEKRLLAKAER